MSLELDQVKQCLEIIDRSLKRLIAPAILIGFSLYFFDFALDDNDNTFLFVFGVIYYIALIVLASFYVTSVLRVAFGEFKEVEAGSENTEIAMYFWILVACYLGSLLIAVVAIYKQLT